MKNSWLKIGLVIGLVASAAYLWPIANAEDDPIKQRKEMMKSVKKSVGVVFNMLKGKTEFDGAKAGDAMKSVSTVPDKFVKLFPKGSIESKGTDSKYSAHPDIWKDMEDFVEKAEELKEKAVEASEAAPNGKGALGAAAKDLIDACKDCHEKYRVKRE